MGNKLQALYNFPKMLYNIVMDNIIIWAAGFLDGEGTITSKEGCDLQQKRLSEETP